MGWNVMDCRFVHSAKEEVLIDVARSPMDRFSSAEQARKAYWPIEVTELGIVSDVRLLHPAKAYSPIEVIPSSMTTEVSPEQALKADELILPTVLGMSI